MAVLIIAGIFLYYFGVNAELSTLAIRSGIIIGIALGALGVFGVVITILKRIF